MTKIKAAVAAVVAFVKAHPTAVELAAVALVAFVIGLVL